MALHVRATRHNHGRATWMLAPLVLWPVMAAGVTGVSVQQHVVVAPRRGRIQ